MERIGMITFFFEDRQGNIYPSSGDNKEGAFQTLLDNLVENGEEIPNFHISHMDFAGIKLPKTKLHEWWFSYCNLDFIDFSGIDFRDSSFEFCSMNSVNLINTKMRFCFFHYCSILSNEVENTDFEKSSLISCVLNLKGKKINLNKSKFDDCLILVEGKYIKFKEPNIKRWNTRIKIGGHDFYETPRTLGDGE